MEHYNMIDAEIQEQRPPLPRYPYLGILTDKDGDIRIVMFSDEKTGMQIYGTGGFICDNGYYCKTWGESQFAPYEGDLILRNRK